MSGLILNNARLLEHRSERGGSFFPVARGRHETWNTQTRPPTIFKTTSGLTFTFSNDTSHAARLFVPTEILLLLHRDLSRSWPSHRPRTEQSGDRVLDWLFITASSPTRNHCCCVISSPIHSKYSPDLPRHFSKTAANTCHTSVAQPQSREFTWQYNDSTIPRQNTLCARLGHA